MMEVNELTVGGFLDLVRPLMQLPPDTPFTIGLGSETLDSNFGDSRAASARRELVHGDALHELACLALTIEPGTKGCEQARLCLDSEWATNRGYRKWREYVYNEALDLCIIEPADGAGNNNPNTQSHDHNEEEKHPAGSAASAADPALDRGGCPGGRVHAGGRDFDPDLDAIGI